MEPKNNPNVDLEKRGLYMQIGLAVALLVVLGALSIDRTKKEPLRWEISTWK